MEHQIMTSLEDEQVIVFRPVPVFQELRQFEATSGGRALSM